MNSNILQDNINQLSLLAAAIIALLTIFVAGKYIQQMKTYKLTGGL